MSWKFGEINRSALPAFLRHFSPIRTAERITDIDLRQLWTQGKRLILVDVDHTIVHWKREEFDEEILAWIRQAQDMGFILCMISNTRHPERLGRIASRLNIEKLRGRFKPSRAMFHEALAKFHVPASAAIMIGDQIMTDILGANRSGIDAILLKPISHEEFFGTKINRGIESLIKPFLFKMITAPQTAGQSVVGPSLKQQILRFVAVGGTSFVIDFALTYLLMKGIRAGDQRLSIVFGSWLVEHFPIVTQHAKLPENAAAPIFGGLASLVAMFNSFVLNRQWTFQAKGNSRTVTQLHRFYTVSILGALLNAVIFGAVYNLPRVGLLAAKVIAAGLVAVWNFTGQRYYAFRRPREAA